MSNWITLRANTFWRIGLVGMALSAAPSYLCGQGAPLSEQAYSTPGQRFVELDARLAKAADTFLVSATQPTPLTTGKTNVAEIQSTSPSTGDHQRSRFSGADGQGAAAMRLSLLLPVVDPILRRHGIPAEFAAVILVESGGRLDALSPKGARGLWQLMPDTARRYGLRVDALQDDRVDLFRATDAAAQYLHDLYAQFGNWKLALAAYNTGEANVGSAILRAHTQDFDQLAVLRMLPLETRNYVPRVFAAAQSIGQSSIPGRSYPPANAITVFAVSTR